MPSSSPAGTPGAPSDLRVRLAWLNVFRLVATTLLLVALALRSWSRTPVELSRDDSLAFALVGVAYVVCLVHGVALRLYRATSRLALLQVGGDVAVATMLVALTGGSESPFAFTYLMAVLAASIVLSPRATLLTAAGCVAALGAVSVLEAQALGGRLALQLGSNALAQLLVAVLASYLNGQLSAAGGRLSQREEDLRSLQTLQEQILESMPSGLLTCDSRGRVTYLNRAGMGILGPAASAHGVDVESLLPGLAAVPLGQRCELEARTPQGRRVLGLTVAALPAPSDGRLIVFQDLTELRAMEVALQRADRLAVAGTLAAQLAHEVRNPLASMRGSAQLLAQDAPPGGPGRRLTDILVREADRLGALVDDFLRFARPAPPRVAPVRLQALLAETLDMLRADPLTRPVSFEQRLLPVEAAVDADQLRQVVLNLVRNACEAAGAGGRVRVTLLREGDRAEIRVWDSGGRLSEADRQRLFEPFFTTRKGGTGLGLATAQAIVHAHGGRITVASSPDAGTEFCVSLPATARAGQGAKEAAVARPGGG